MYVARIVFTTGQIPKLIKTNGAQARQYVDLETCHKRQRKPSFCHVEIKSVAVSLGFACLYIFCYC